MPRDMTNATPDELQQRISDLEDFVAELVPFSVCSDWDSQIKITAPTKSEAIALSWNFQRDAMFIDKRIFYKAAKLMVNRYSEPR